MSRRLGAIRRRRDHSFTTWMNRVVTVVLPRIEDSPATGSMSRSSAWRYFSGRPSRCFSTQCSTPVCTIPATTTKSSATTITELELNPASASRASSVPVTSSTAMPPRNTSSACRRVMSSKAKMPTAVSSVTHSWKSRPDHTHSLIDAVCYPGLYKAPVQKSISLQR